MRYRKKPVEIEARQFTGDNRDELTAWIGEDATFNDGAIYIRTLEGLMRADINDFIIKGVAGEYYPCRADIFVATYDEVP